MHFDSSYLIGPDARQTQSIHSRSAQRHWFVRLPLLAAAILVISHATLSQNSVDPWQSSQLMKPEALAKILSAKTGKKPVIIHVGFPFFYENGHIPGSVPVGASSKPAGIEELKKMVRDIPRDQEVVIYCGCCPWKECPNIRPAFRTLTDLGFRKIRVLELPHSFHIDWVQKKFPVQLGNATSHD